MEIHLGILAIVVLLNLIPDKFINRRKWILPISFLLILAYWALRYDYGLDYWDYLRSFYAGTEGKESRGFGEPGYYIFANLFSSFYQVIIAQSIIVIGTLFYMVRKYVPTNCYWLFFILFLLVPRFHFVMISALRNSLAACVMFWAFDLCYINKKRWPLYIVFVFFAALFHTTALVFLVFPFIHYFFSRTRGMSVFTMLIIADILSLFVVNFLFNFIISQSELTETYANYDELIGESNLIGVIFKSVILIPAFFICKSYNKQKLNTPSRNLFVLSFFFLIIDLFGFNFGGRFTLYLYLFFIISLALTYQNRKATRLVLLTPYLLYIVFGFYQYYQRLIEGLTNVYSEGNYLFYHTIFEASPLP